MDTATYRARCAAGKCVATNSCDEPVCLPGRKCKHHKKRRKQLYAANEAKIRREDYAARKASGRCTIKCCPRNAGNTLLCEPHEKAKQKREAGRCQRMTEEQKRAKRRRERAYKAKRRRERLCIRCNRKRVTTKYCVKHRNDDRAYWRRARERQGFKTGIKFCRLCLEAGLGRDHTHISVSCPYADPDVPLPRAPLMDIDRDAYASARPGAGY